MSSDGSSSYGIISNSGFPRDTEAEYRGVGVKGHHILLNILINS